MLIATLIHPRKTFIRHYPTKVTEGGMITDVIMVCCVAWRCWGGKRSCDYQLTLGPRTGGYFGGEQPLAGWAASRSHVTRGPKHSVLGRLSACDVTRLFVPSLCVNNPRTHAQSAFLTTIGRKVQMCQVSELNRDGIYRPSHSL